MRNTGAERERESKGMYNMDSMGAGDIERYTHKPTEIGREQYFHREVVVMNSTS